MQRVHDQGAVREDLLLVDHHLAAGDSDRLVHRPVDQDFHSIDREAGNVRGGVAGAAVQGPPGCRFRRSGGDGDSGDGEVERGEIGIRGNLVRVADHPRAWNLCRNQGRADRVEFAVQRIKRTWRERSRAQDRRYCDRNRDWDRDRDRRRNHGDAAEGLSSGACGPFQQAHRQHAECHKNPTVKHSVTHRFPPVFDSDHRAQALVNPSGRSICRRLQPWENQSRRTRPTLHRIACRV